MASNSDDILKRYAMKIIKSAPQYQQAAKSEIEYLQIISDMDPFVLNDD